MIELKEKLEGKTVKLVEPIIDKECICRFVLTDGTSFRLYATDLGAWIEDDVNVDGITYNSLNSLIRAYEIKFDDSKPNILNDGEYLVISHGDKVFRVRLCYLSIHETTIINHKIGLGLLAEAIIQGDWWTGYFCNGIFRGKNIPDELIFKT